MKNITPEDIIEFSKKISNPFFDGEDLVDECCEFFDVDYSKLFRGVLASMPNDLQGQYQYVYSGVVFGEIKSTCPDKRYFVVNINIYEMFFKVPQIVYWDCEYIIYSENACSNFKPISTMGLKPYTSGDAKIEMARIIETDDFPLCRKKVKLPSNFSDIGGIQFSNCAMEYGTLIVKKDIYEEYFNDIAKDEIRDAYTKSNLKLIFY